MAIRHAGRFLAIAAATLVILAGCGDDDDELAPTDGTPTIEATTTTTTPTVSPSPSPVERVGAMLVFLRAPADPYGHVGTLWMIDAAGLNARQISPQGVLAAFAGSGRNEGGRRVVYYVADEGANLRSIWAYDVDSGTSSNLFSYEAIPDAWDAAVSPDGTNIVFLASSGLSLHEMSTGETRLLFDLGQPGGCDPPLFDQCQYYVAPQWSAGGQLVLTTRVIYEGGWVQVIDPFVEPPRTFIDGSRAVPSSGRWSPNGDAVCGTGVGLAEPAGVYVLRAPDWALEDRFPEYRDPSLNLAGRYVTDCGWPTESEVVYTTSLSTAGGAELDLLDVNTGDWRIVREFPEVVTCCSSRVTPVQGSRSVIAQFSEEGGDTGFRWAQPQLVDIDTGDARPILQAEDVVVAAFAD
jgi:hypothetical protein